MFTIHLNYSGQLDNKIEYYFHVYVYCNFQKVSLYTDFKPFQYLRVVVVEFILHMIP